MNFPIIPIPSFVLEFFPLLRDIHIAFGLLGGILCLFLGLLNVLLASPESDRASRSEKNDLRFGFILIGIAILFALTGAYIGIPLITFVVIYVVYLIIRAFKMAFLD